MKSRRRAWALEQMGEENFGFYCALRDIELPWWSFRLQWKVNKALRLIHEEYPFLNLPPGLPPLLAPTDSSGPR